MAGINSIELSSVATTNAELTERTEFARQRERAADEPGMGRNPKARRQFRILRELAEAEAEKRAAVQS
jgi:hypothetical protein